MSFAAMMARKPRTARPTMSPVNETPLCFPMDSPLSKLLDAIADPLEVPEIHPDQESAALDVVVRDESPVAAVAALVAVVTHHEIVPRGDRAAETVVIVFAILPMGELPDLREIHRGLRRHDHHLVVVVAELLEEGRQAQVVQFRVGVEADALPCDRLAVDREALAAIGH